MVLLSVDPGTRFTGWAVMLRCDGRTELLDYGCLVLGSGPLVDRVVAFYDSLVEILAGFPVTDIAIETPFMGKSVSTYGKLSYLRGILYLLAGQRGYGLYEYAPRDVKKSVTGHGGASKEEVARLVCNFFSLPVSGIREDTTDALAVGLCCLWGGKPGTIGRQISFL